MKTIKILNKIILILISVGLLTLLMLPGSLSAGHFRSGTMSWKLAENDNDTIILHMLNGWTFDHNCCDTTSVDDVKSNWDWAGDGTGTDGNPTIYWESDGSPNTGATLDFTVTSVDISADHILTKMGDSSSGWETGITHDYDNGTFLIYWAGYARTAVKNKEDGYSSNGGTSMGNSNRWRLETMVRIGGDYAGNVSPVSAVPPIVKVQDNSSFSYQVVATDDNGDNLTYRWGQFNEFFKIDGSGSTATYTMPTGMTLSPSGLIEWDIRDNVTCDGCTNDDDVDNTTNKLWVAVIMVEDRLDNGTAKSKIPIDFFFEVTDPTNAPPSFTAFPTGTQTVVIGDNKTFTIKSTDDSGVAPTVSVVNPPSDNKTIWDNSSSTSGGITTFSVYFAPDNTSDSSYVVNIRSTDAIGMTKDKSLSINVSSIANDDPTAPTLVSPADNSTVTNPVSFQWTESTDPDNDNVSYTIYICQNIDFTGCNGTSVTASANFIPPFNQNFHDTLLSWPSPLQAATISQEVSQDLSMMPKWVILLGVLGLLSVFIFFSVKIITHLKIVIMLFLIIIGAVNCSKSDDTDDVVEAVSDVTNTASTNTDSNYTSSDLTTNTTYYWKVIASDTNGGSAESETWSFTVQ